MATVRRTCSTESDTLLPVTTTTALCPAVDAGTNAQQHFTKCTAPLNKSSSAH